MIRVIRDKLEEEIVFTIALIAALVTSIWISPRGEAIDGNVLMLLFDLMLISLALEKYHLLDFIAMSILKRAKSEQSIGLVMMLTTAGLGMLITNDVALITVVPITIAMSKKAKFDPFRVIVIETLAANIGSSLTPFGNPQNLYLYNFFKMEALPFVQTMLPFVAIGMTFLIVINMFLNRERLHFQLQDIKIRNIKKVIVYLVLFVGVVCSVLHLLPYWTITGLIVLAYVLMDLELFMKVDYFLLGTFVMLFIFIDNMNRMEWVVEMAQQLLNAPVTVYIFSGLMSQGISNVPTSILVSGFTNHTEAVLLGVSVGGMGTLIASLANLISYKFYIKAYDRKAYKKYFYQMNVLGFLIVGALTGLYLLVMYY